MKGLGVKGAIRRMAAGDGCVDSEGQLYILDENEVDQEVRFLRWTGEPGEWTVVSALPWTDGWRVVPRCTDCVEGVIEFDDRWCPVCRGSGFTGMCFVPTPEYRKLLRKEQT